MSTTFVPASSETIAMNARRTRARIVAALLSVGVAPSAVALAPGEDGVRVTIPVSGTDDTAYAAALDAAGDIVMAGATSNGSSALASITRTGQINTAFGTANGVVLYNLSTSTDTLTAIAHMDDGRYGGCGVYFSAGTANDFFTARFMSDGSLDTTFDGSGYSVTSFLQSGPGGSAPRPVHCRRRADRWHDRLRRFHCRRRSEPRRIDAAYGQRPARYAVRYRRQGRHRCVSDHERQLAGQRAAHPARRQASGRGLRRRNRATPTCS